jgi:streptogramin lyase
MRIDLLSLAVLIVGCLLVGQASVAVEVADSASPAVQVTPLILSLGESVKIDYTVAASNSSGSGLKQVELWRQEEDGVWQEILRNTLAGETTPISGSFTDSPLGPGKYWYGVHVVDNAGNWNDEQNANTANLPGNLGPAEVAVVDPASPIVLAFQVTPLSAHS